jgi:beta-1,4-mannosyltransferase
MTRHRRSALAVIKCILLWAFVVRVKLTRSAIVRTVHNVRPHEPGSRLEKVVLAALDRATTIWVVLNPTTPTPAKAWTRLIPHGHYRDWYAIPTEQSIRGRILTFGLQRSYKGTGTLIQAFLELKRVEAQLRICGKPATEKDRRDIVQLSEGAPEVSIDLRFLSDDELTLEIAQAEVVVLPYQGIHNSGAALLALSLNRPIVVPKSSATDLLAHEFGRNWVHTYDGPMTAEALEDALTALRSTPREAELDMSTRDWEALARLLEQAYREAIKRVRGDRN